MTIMTMQLGYDTFDVTVRDNNSETRHGVVLTDTLLKELTRGKSSKEQCVRAAFRFLLEREPKEEIFRRFDVAMIETYFPEFREKLAGYLEPSHITAQR